MAKRKTSAVIPTNPIDTVESVPAQPLRLNTSCHEMLAELHDPAIPKSDIQQKLIAAKQKLDVILGLMPDSSGWVSRFGVAPYGGKNIVGTYVHEKLQNGVPTGQFCITVLVRQKPLKGSFIFDRIPDSVDGVATDIVALSGGKQHARPGETVLSPHDGIFERGTLGAVVDCGDPHPYLLSNQHVLNHSLVNDPDHPLPIFDGNFIQIGTLRAWSEEDDPELDAAIAEVTGPGAVVPQFADFELDPTWMTDEEVVAASQLTGGLLVKKVGRKTGLTTGIISSTGHFEDVPVDGRVLRSQWVVVSTSSTAPFSDEGDSGSLVVAAASNRPIGLLWGSDLTSPFISYANRLTVVTSAFRIQKFLN
jgi:hypothetical protein